MPTCVRCNKNIGVVGSFLSFNNQTQTCGNCQKAIQSEFNRLRQEFLGLCQDGMFSQEKHQYLQSQVRLSGLDWQSFLVFIRGDALWFLEKSLTFAANDGIITEQEERHFYWLQNIFQIPVNFAQPLMERLQYLKQISNIRQGNLPTFQSSTHLDSDEICRLEIAATYHKVNLRSIRQIHGRFIITDKKIHFLSPDGGWTILWKNVARVQNDVSGIYLELSTKSGNGFYKVPDPLLTEAIINTIARMNKRQLLAPQTESQSRHISQDVRTAVWQRDQGKCVQCGATSYLEFDHIIPYSKGGANTLNNIQLLCRNCNLQKRDRI